MNRKFNYLLALTLGASMFTACNTNSPTVPIEVTDSTTVSEKEARRDLPFAVTPAELCADFTLNKEHAVTKYDDVTISISGIVQSAQSNVPNDCNYVTLGCDLANADTTAWVIKLCMESHVDLSNVKPGDTVTIEAEYDQKMDNFLLFEDGIIKTTN